MTHTPQEKLAALAEKWRKRSGEIAKPYGLVTEHSLGTAQALDSCADELTTLLSEHGGGGEAVAWNYESDPPEGGDQRKICTIEQDGMVYVGIAIWTSAAQRWMQNGAPILGRVLAWQDLPQPATGRWVHGELLLAESPPPQPRGEGMVLAFVRDFLAEYEEHEEEEWSPQWRELGERARVIVDAPECIDCAYNPGLCDTHDPAAPGEGSGSAACWPFGSGKARVEQKDCPKCTQASYQRHAVHRECLCGQYAATGGYTPPPASQSAERAIGDIADECMRPDGICNTCFQPLYASQSPEKSRSVIRREHLQRGEQPPRFDGGGDGLPSGWVEVVEGLRTGGLEHEPDNEFLRGLRAGKRQAADLIEVTLRRLAATGQGVEWQPIETAPKDETVLLLGWNSGKRESGAHIVIGSNYHGRWLDRGMDEANRDLGNTLAYITHWMPLPAAATQEPVRDAQGNAICTCTHGARCPIHATQEKA